MRREIELDRRLRSLRALGEAVGAMKSLSAHHFREARLEVLSARSYREGVERVLGCSGASLAAGSGAAGVLVIGAELGLCGSYNAQVVEAATKRRGELGRGPTVCVGRRAAILLERRGVELRKTYGGPTSVRGIPGLLLDVAEDLLSAYASEDLSSFEIIASQFAGVGRSAPRSYRLLPFEAPVTAACPPVRYVDFDQFSTAALREFLYIGLYDLLLDALASEHAARLIATQSAEKWLDERAERLNRELKASRRETSTQEMIEIAAGARGGSRNR